MCTEQNSLAAVGTKLQTSNTIQVTTPHVMLLITSSVYYRWILAMLVRSAGAEAKLLASRSMPIKFHSPSYVIHVFEWCVLAGGAVWAQKWCREGSGSTSTSSQLPSACKRAMRGGVIIALFHRCSWHSMLQVSAVCTIDESSNGAEQCEDDLAQSAACCSSRVPWSGDDSMAVDATRESVPDSMGCCLQMA